MITVFKLKREEDSLNCSNYAMLYPQNGDHIVTIDYVERHFALSIYRVKWRHIIYGHNPIAILWV